MRGLIPTLLLVCAASAQTVAIRNVTLIDGTGAPPRTTSIVIRKGRIAAVGVRAPKRVRTINGAGKYAIPGLWDMHVHLWDANPRLADYLRWGVVGVRDAGSDYARTNGWRQAIARGNKAGPHIYTSGEPLDGRTSREPKLPSIAVPTPAQAQVGVDLLYDRGVDYVKVLSSLSKDAYLAIAQRCRVRRIPFAGHIPREVTPWEAIQARQYSMEHLLGLLDVPEADRPRLLQELRLYEIWQVPSLTLWRREKQMAAHYDSAAALVRDMARAGVGIIAGTDTGDPGVKQGGALHEELELLVTAGLTPMQALQAATRNAGLFFGEENTFGTLEKGRRADLVLLDADPLADIRNTRRIALVLKGGRTVWSKPSPTPRRNRRAKPAASAGPS